MKTKSMVKAMIAGAMLLVGIGASAYAANPGNAFIVLKCTTTLSVSLVAPNEWYNFGDVSAASVVYSTSPITVRNNSTGAICRWDMNIDNASLNGWKLASSPSLDQVAIWGVFKKGGQAAVGDFDLANSTMSTSVIEYNNTHYFNASYNADGYSPDGMSNDASKILPKAYADISGQSSDRDLWLRLATPLAVTDQLQRTLTLVITAKVAS